LSGLGAGPGAGAATLGTELRPDDFNFFFHAKGGVFKGDGYLGAQVGAALGRFAGGGRHPAEEGVENIAKAAEVEPLEAPGIGAFGTNVAEGLRRLRSFP
jgi:hypothetical protein